MLAIACVLAAVAIATIIVVVCWAPNEPPPVPVAEPTERSEHHIG